MTIAPLGLDDLDEVRAMLVASDLPVDDIGDPTIVLFGARDGDALLGVVGVQNCGDTALLRSLAVRAESRSRGVGRRLCDHALAHVRERGLPDAYLLTTSAADYFLRQGFAAVHRDDVPPSVQATSQFASLCPSTALVMRRTQRIPE